MAPKTDERMCRYCAGDQRVLISTCLDLDVFVLMVEGETNCFDDSCKNRCLDQRSLPVSSLQLCNCTANTRTWTWLFGG